MPPGQLTASLRETVALFDDATPLTTSEVAQSLGIGRRGAYDRLDRLAERGRVETKKVGASARVWWRPPPTPTGDAARARSTPAASSLPSDAPDVAFVDALDGAEVAMFVFDEESEAVWATGAVERYFGIDRDRVLGRDASTLVEDHLAPLVADPERFADAALASPRDAGALECRVLAGDDREERWLERHGEPIESGAYAGGRVEFYYDVTDRKRSERAHRADHEQLESLVAAVEEYAIFALDAEGRVRTWNDGARRIKGYESDDILGEHFSTFYTDDDREAGLPGENLARAAAEGSVEDEGWRVRRDGSRFWANVTITAVRDDEGELRGYVKVTRDMTDRRTYEQELERKVRDLETELDDVFARIDDGFFALDGDLRFTYANERAGEILDRRVEGLLGGHVRDVLDPGPKVEAAFAEAFESQEQRTFEEHSDPLSTWFEYHVYPSESGLSVYFEDVTERKERERELERYEAIVETVQDGVYTVDADGRFTTVNEAYAELTGYPRAELLGAHVSTVVDEEAVDRAREAERELASGEREMAQFEADVTTADGDTVRAEATFALLPGDDRERVGVVRDVTDRIERERRIESQRERLAALDHLNEVTRDIIDAVIDRSSREEIERAVCERLAASDSYPFAWIGDVDAQSRTVTARAVAGVDGYLDDLTVSVDPEDERSDGATGRALRTGEIQTTRDVREDARYDPWRARVEEYGVRSSAAIPIVHDDAVYGVLNVYAERPGAFEGEEREVVGQLGEVVGHAIAAAERKRALLSDDVVELEFHVPDVFDAVGAGGAPPGRISLDHVIPTGGDEFLVYGSATADAVDSVTAIAETVSHWTDVTIHDGTGNGEATFELSLTEPPVLSALASLGGSVVEAVVEDGDYYMTIHLSPSADVRRMTDVVEESYPGARLLKRRQTTRPDLTAQRVRHVLVAELTERQRSALEAAYHAGFFEWPRDASGKDVAESLGVTPPTFHQHIRKAEAKVFASLLSS